ncbi:MAG: HD-GYP domain-containing protein [Candidatus Aquicultor sp.]|nr:HD-GYP domain-containing protein [Candidatus Aquicultor sp.]
MKDITSKARIFFYSVYAAAFVVLLASLITKPSLSWADVAFFALFIFVADSFTISLPKNASISVSFAVIFAAALLFGPQAVVIASLITVINISDLKRKIAWYKMVFSACNYVISAYAAGYVYILTGGSIGGITVADFPYIIVPVVFASTVFFAINTGLIAFGVGLLNDESPVGIWRFDYQWLIPNYFALGVLGLVLAQIYYLTGPASFVLLIVPLLIARQTFQVYMQLRGAYLDTVKALVQALEAKDPYTRGHSERVAKYAEQIARELKLPEDRVETLRYAALLHDIGKIGIARKILNKPGKLNNEEFKKIQAHPRIGAGILSDIDFLEKAIPAVYYHHEHLNGRGYGEGLAGERIPLLARIMTVADSFDAMTSTRSYRPAMSVEEAAEELMACSNRQFDGEVVEAFMRTLDLSMDEAGPEIKELQLSIAVENPA